MALLDITKKILNSLPSAQYGMFGAGGSQPSSAGGGGGGGSWGGTSISQAYNNTASPTQKAIQGAIYDPAPSQPFTQMPGAIPSGPQSLPNVPDQYTPAPAPSTPSSYAPSVPASPVTNAPMTPVAPEPAPMAPTPPPVDPYESVYRELDKLSGLFPDQQAELESRIGDITQQQIGGINQSLNTQIGGLGSYRDSAASDRDTALGQLARTRAAREREVQSGQKRTLNELAQDLINGMQSANNYLGVTGSGDSSASPMYAFALQQAANRNRAGVMNQGNEALAGIGDQFQSGEANILNTYQKNLSDLSMKENEIKQFAQEQISNAQTWKAQQLADIASQFQELQRAIQSGRVDIKSQSVSDWVNRLNALEDQANQYTQSIATWGAQRLAQLNDAKLQMQNSAQFNPQQIVQQEINAIPQFSFQRLQQQPPAYLR